MRKFDLTKIKKSGIILLYGKALQSEGRTEAAVRQCGSAAVRQCGSAAYAQCCIKKETDLAYESKFKKEDIDELFEAVLTLRDLEDCYRFFEDICTINELHAIAQRLQVAKLLSEKKTYSEIEAITNASTATISRINKCLIYGADGYQRVLERLKEKEKAKA